MTVVHQSPRSNCDALDLDRSITRGERSTLSPRTSFSRRRNSNVPRNLRRWIYAFLSIGCATLCSLVYHRIAQSSLGNLLCQREWHPDAAFALFSSILIPDVRRENSPLKYSASSLENKRRVRQATEETWYSSTSEGTPRLLF
ncbi:hypothetical protein L596_025961 [Steinernema carpocapsae]|uniref:Uncharacterized protein n=1 Tax=Steinernema carpocapsae TaxID=34508 RepID=A0A4U5M9E7_STECR|nr:hypothetical protein L596_025961 [Steinernema carpocapsae]